LIGRDLNPKAFVIKSFSNRHKPSGNAYFLGLLSFRQSSPCSSRYFSAAFLIIPETLVISFEFCLIFGFFLKPYRNTPEIIVAITHFYNL
jgi:hypothetical protein